MAITRKIESKISNFQTTERVVFKKTKQKHPFYMKRQSTEWKKILGNYIFDKGLIFQNIQRAHKSQQQKKKGKKKRSLI